MTEIIADVSRPAKGSFEEWKQFTEVSKDLAIGRLSEAWFEEVETMVRGQISENTAPATSLRSVQKLNPDSFWGLFRRQDDGGHELVGFYGQLLLNEKGHQALIDRTLDRRSPQAQFLTAYKSVPNAVYIWCVVAKKKAAILQAALMQQLRESQSGMPYYAALATDDSIKIGRQIGLAPVTPEDDCLGGLFRFSTVLPTLRSVSKAPEVLRVAVVQTQGEFDQAKLIRTATFIDEQNCPQMEEFDGNDFSAQHIIGFVNDKPAATMRIRYFADFAKWERFCVLKQYRRSKVKDQLLNFADELVRRKGFQHIYFHAEPSLENFWQKRGFSRAVRGEQLRFSDRTYTEFCKSIGKHGSRLSLLAAPMVLNRVEGCWDDVGILELSEARSKDFRSQILAQTKAVGSA